MKNSQFKNVQQTKSELKKIQEDQQKIVIKQDKQEANIEPTIDDFNEKGNFLIDLRLGRQSVLKGQNLQDQPKPYSSDYFQDYSRENYRIQQAFQSNNYQYLRDLPNKLEPGAIFEAQKEKIDQVKHQSHLQSQEEGDQKKSKVVKLLGGGYFSPFEYRLDDYDFVIQLRREEQEKNKQIQEKISKTDFRPNDVRVKLKYEAPFYTEDLMKQDPKNRLQNLDNKKAQYPIYPFHFPDDTYDVLKESNTRQRIISEAKRLYQDWKPNSKHNEENQTTNPKIVENVVNEIKRVLASDWKKTKFLIGINEKEQVEVIFDLATVEQINVLITYMNALVNDERVTQFKFKRAIQNWATKNRDKNTITFTFSPPWLKTLHFEAYYACQQQTPYSESQTQRQRSNSQFSSLSIQKNEI